MGEPGAAEVSDIEAKILSYGRMSISLHELQDARLRSFNSLFCPLCGGWHEVKYEYNGIPLLACEKAEKDKLYCFNSPS